MSFIFRKLFRDDSFLTKGETWFKCFLILAVAFIYYISGIGFHLALSGSDVNGLYFDIHHKTFVDAKTTYSPSDVERFDDCQSKKNCSPDAKYTSIPRDQFVAFCIPDKTHTDMAIKAGLFNSNLCPYGGAPLSKHISGIPGDTLEIKMDGVYVNGKMIVNSRIDNLSASVWKIGDKITIPEGYYFISGQNKRSFDSRYFGLVYSGLIITKSYLLYRI